MKYRLIILLSAMITIALSALFLDYIFPLNLKRFEDTSTVILSRDLTPFHVFQTTDEKWRIKTEVQDVSPLYIQTLILREDKHFWHHMGVNPVSLIRAVYQRLRWGKYVSGGSTLTMQTVRLLEPRPRTIVSKVKECFRAMQLEWHFNKRDILNMYLTLTPLGSNIEGVNAGAMIYFNKNAKELNAQEAAFLVALSQSPTKLRSNKYAHLAFNARNRILDLMRNQKLITQAEFNFAQQTQVPHNQFNVPREAPQLAWRLKSQHPKQDKIVSTIDLSLQKHIKTILEHYGRFIPSKANAAIFVIDHSENEAVAYVASRDFFNSEKGQIDYIRAWRSPGSTLKPFIYAMAFDLGITQPESYILDDKRRFGAYLPRNFDKDIHGVVQVKDALAMSLNIPAVALLNEMGVLRFLGKLKQVGIEPKFPQSMDAPSLASALGGLGMTLEQLVELYAALAHEGTLIPLQYIKAPSNKEAHYLFSPWAARQVTDILAQGQQRRISVKTGTSYGHRDALAIGYDSQYVVGVWIGAPDGSPLPGTTGTSHAVPLLNNVFKALPVTHLALAPEKPLTFQLRKQQLKRAELYKEKPALMFPVHESVVEFSQKAIPLSVSGGKRPYMWLIDDELVVSQHWQQNYFWTPPKPGYYRLVVVDANGQRDGANIEIRE